MKEKLIHKLLPLLTFVLFVPFVAKVFTSIEARSMLFLSFFCLFVVLFYSVRSNKGIEIFFTLAITASFILVLHNTSLFTADFFKSLTTNQEVILTQEYDSTGFISFGSSHSYFFQTSYLMHLMSSLFGMPPLMAVYGMLVIFIFLMALIGFYVLEILRNRTAAKPFAMSLVAFFVVSSATMEVASGSFYRDLGLAFLLLFVCFYLAKPRVTTAEFLLTSVFVIGVTLGSPIAATILILFFSVLSVFSYQRARANLFYALIPLSYMVFVAQEYVLRLGKYTRFGFSGLMDFLLAIFGGHVPERVIPWERATLSFRLDTFLGSSSYLSLLLLAMLIVLSTLLLLRHNKPDRKSGGCRAMDERALLKAFCVYLLVVLVIFGVTYIGTSTRSETPFSDIRTIALFFLTAMLPFAFLHQELLNILFSKKALLAILAALILLASFRMVFSVYPKSGLDPINAVEDFRLSQTVHDVGHFVKDHFDSGYFVVDFRMRIILFSLLSSQENEVRLLNENALASLPSLQTSVLIFHVNGIRYPSVFVPPKAYIEAYNFSQTRNRVYDNGDVLIVILRSP
jgi:hypothetical protein